MGLLEKLFLSKTRAEVLRLLFGLCPAELHVRAIERESGMTVGAVREELRKLQTLDLVVGRRDGNRVYYTANQSHPLFEDLRALVLKTDGLGERVRVALQDGEIEVAFIFGSLAAEVQRSRSDVDLMVIGRVGPREIARRLMGVSDSVGREINPVVMTVAEFRKRVDSRDGFVADVLSKPKLFVIGDQRELEALA